MPELEIAGRTDPPSDSDELHMLVGWLDYQRETVPAKVEGVTLEDAVRPLVPSGTTLLGLVKHLAYVERYWFRMMFVGQRLPDIWTDPNDPDPEFRIEPGETVDSVVALYRDEVAAARTAIDGANLDRVAVGRPFSLRWILCHMIEETARHLGHMDILRELIDGAVGT